MDRISPIAPELAIHVPFYYENPDSATTFIADNSSQKKLDNLNFHSTSTEKHPTVRRQPWNFITPADVPTWLVEDDERKDYGGRFWYQFNLLSCN